MPNLKNILIFPDVQVARAERPGQLRIHVDGLACNSICVRRVRGALRRLDGASSVNFDPLTDGFLVKFGDDPPIDDEVKAAVMSQVAFPWFRRLLAWLAQAIPRLGERKLT